MLDPYQGYEAVLKRWFGPRGYKYWSQAFETTTQSFDPQAICQELVDAVAGSSWDKPLAGSNWKWRTGQRPARGAGEVALERAVIEAALAAGRDEWTFQVPTMSGVGGADRHRRRSIDLVRRLPNDVYELIELKTASTNPVHAGFEIVFYMFAYCRARDSLRHSPDEAHALLTARRVDLLVLAPAVWYRYKLRTGAFASYKTTRLSNFFNELLACLRRSLSLPGLDEISLSFCYFQSERGLLATVTRGEQIARWSDSPPVDA